MKQRTVHLGFEIGTGEPVEIPVKHLCVTGQTQESGKTTTLEALISRAGLKALAFVTKRGEGSFPNARTIQPYFREQTDWKYVAAILEASRMEKLKWERAWIIRASKGAKTLAEVQTNVREALKKAKGQSESAYLCLDAYLDDVVPYIGQMKWASTVDLQPGINVMNLETMNVEMQHLVLRSSIEWMLNHGEPGSLVVIPEAWKFIPQGRGTPVKLAAESYIRQAAGIPNFLWLDSQDIAGIDKIILKSVPVWLLGVQRESNEIERTLAQIPAGIKKPSKADIATLGLGQFFTCWGTHIKKVYVQPEWMETNAAREFAKTGQVPINMRAFRQPRSTRVTVSRVNSVTKAQSSEPPPATLQLTVPPAYENDLLERMGGKPLTEVFPEGLKITMRGDTVERVEPNRDMGFGVFTPPPGALFFVDDGGKSVDQQEREHFQTEIHNLQRTIYQLMRAMPQANLAKSLTFDQWLAQGSPDALRSASSAIVDARLPGTSGNEVFKAESVTAKVAELLMNNDALLAMIAERIPLGPIVQAVAKRLPTNGVVQVEPREAVLNQYQRAEVARILAAVDGFSLWQKNVLRFVEAKGSRIDKKDLVISILGRQTANMARDFRAEYEEVDELVKAGYLREDSRRPAPNLARGIREKLAIYEPSDDEIQAVVDKIIISLPMIEA